MEKNTFKKKRNPRFVRQDAFNIKSLNPKWRKPKGIHSKIRMSIKGHRKLVKIGHRNPASIRDTYNGLPIFYVKNINSIEKIPQESMLIISSSLGFRSKKAIIEKAQQSNMKILNIKHPKEFLEKAKKKLDEKKNKKQISKKLTTQKQEIKEQPIKEKPNHQLSEKELKEKEAHERRKLLEKPK